MTSLATVRGNGKNNLQTVAMAVGVGGGQDSYGEKTLDDVSSLSVVGENPCELHNGFKAIVSDGTYLRCARRSGSTRVTSRRPWRRGGNGR